MKTIMLKGLIGAATVLVSVPAFCAAQNTSWFSIGNLAASTGSANGYRVYPAAGSPLPTGQNCASSDFAEIQDGLTLSDKNMINRTLLAAFMSGRQIQLRLDGCGVTGRPAYRIVRMSAGQ